ncbi:pilus assembly PilX family protein [Lysobacter silvisoli]|uniref:Type 4 fimbrial biogenesis protein PilX N-terminal domain-containing protein n=1 Tax=Lysobacter silvisoli TaxID=2293254 RepID=A0A371K5K1_9GAMM|nr:PilX N-terminal domain-containing pilus assembly protein [Lysobacter silvisoli]RDZ29213.1 hypothetical protein DX914_09030 [Lysobacter silvisoli]
MSRSGFHGPRKQQGAALYVALIFLIILALLGVTGMQVATMQERMSANYLATNLAFQRAEAASREAELTAGPSIPLEENCGGFSPEQFGVDAAIKPPSPAEEPVRVRNIKRCIPGGDLSLGKRPESEDVFARFRITAYREDRPADPTSDAVVDSIFIQP